MVSTTLTLMPITGPSISANVWIKSVRQSMTIFFSLEVTLALFKQITYVFLDNAFPNHVPGILCHNILWISGLKPFLI
jgi:hypothetical protein